MSSLKTEKQHSFRQSVYCVW